MESPTEHLPNRTDSQEALAHFRPTILNHFKRGFALAFLRAKSPEEIRTRASDNLQESFAAIENEFDQILTSADSDQNRATKLSELVTAALLEKYSLHEIESRLREEAIRNDPQTDLNGFTSFKTSFEQPNELSVHTFLNLTRTSVELVHTFRAGLQTLAKILDEDAKSGNRGLYTKINTISATAWINYEHPEIIERFGFKITKKDDVEGRARAEISREDFLKKFLKSA